MCSPMVYIAAPPGGSETAGAGTGSPSGASSSGVQTAEHKCVYCTADIRGLRVRCTQTSCGPNFNLCSECFACQVELGTHRRTHPYEIIVSLDNWVFTRFIWYYYIYNRCFVENLCVSQFNFSYRIVAIPYAMQVSLRKQKCSSVWNVSIFSSGWRQLSSVQWTVRVAGCWRKPTAWFRGKIRLWKLGRHEDNAFWQKRRGSQDTLWAVLHRWEYRCAPDT